MDGSLTEIQSYVVEALTLFQSTTAYKIDS